MSVNMNRRKVTTIVAWSILSLTLATNIVRMVNKPVPLNTSTFVTQSNYQVYEFAKTIAYKWLDYNAGASTGPTTLSKYMTNNNLIEQNAANQNSGQTNIQGLNFSTATESQKVLAAWVVSNYTLWNPAHIIVDVEAQVEDFIPGSKAGASLRTLTIQVPVGVGSNGTDGLFAYPEYVPNPSVNQSVSDVQLPNANKLPAVSTTTTDQITNTLNTFFGYYFSLPSISSSPDFAAMVKGSQTSSTIQPLNGELTFKSIGDVVVYDYMSNHANYMAYVAVNVQDPATGVTMTSEYIVYLQKSSSSGITQYYITEMQP